MKKFMLLGLLTSALMVAASSSQANFIQCLGGLCDGSEFADIINGTQLADEIGALLGDDVVFGNGGPDFIFSDNGNDLLFGGNGSDFMDGQNDNDHLLAGPDDGMYSQEAHGFQGNDTFYTFASETTTCLNFYGGFGQDTVNLIGFGPYSAHWPFGLDLLFTGPIVVVDPIAGGNVLIWINDGDFGIETIHGLPSPNVAILSQPEFAALNCPPLHPDIES